MKNKLKIMKTRKSVNGLQIGGVFNVEGENYIVTKLPTRYTVCGKNQSPSSGKPNGIKTSINHTNTLFWVHNKTGGTICPTHPLPK